MPPPEAEKNETKSENNMTTTEQHKDNGQKALCSDWEVAKAPRASRLTFGSVHVDYEVGREIKLDFSRYDVVLRCTETYSLDSVFEAICRNECSEISEKEGALTIEIVEKEEVVAS